MASFSLKPLRAQSGELLHLDLMRFIAASGIVFHHSKEFFFRPSQRLAIHRQMSGLALFVDLFFVISGYVIAYIYENRMKSLADYGKFMQRRIGRLVPLHWLTLVCSMVLWVILLKAGAPSRLAVYRPECIAMTVALLHGGLSCNGTIFNGQSWSISAEMAMYLLFPLFVFLGMRRRWFLLPAGFTVLAVIAAVLLTWHATLMDAWTLSLRGVVRALPSFIIGVGMWFLRDTLQRIPYARALLAVAVVSLVCSMMTAAPVLVVLSLIYVTAVAAIAADLQKKVGRIVTVVAPLGQLTYSIYMWHEMFILVLMNSLGDKVLHAGAAAMVPLALLTYGLILAWGYVSFIYLETPARQWVDSLPPYGRSR